jgi:hypothetical protein
MSATLAAPNTKSFGTPSLQPVPNWTCVDDTRYERLRPHPQPTMERSWVDVSDSLRLVHLAHMWCPHSITADSWDDVAFVEYEVSIFENDIPLVWPEPIASVN